MKKFVMTVAACLLATSAMAEDVRLGTEGAYAPWNFMNDAGNVDGFEIELGNELCKRASLNCTWVVNEWDTIIPNLVAGNYDAIIAGMSITDERKQTIDFTEGYFPPDPSRYVALAGQSFDFDNLAGARIAVQGATIQAGYVEENFGANNTILSYETADQTVADLMAGNVDLILADGGYLEPVIKGTSGAIAFTGPSPMIGGGVGMGLRKEDDALEAKLNDAIASVKADGTLDDLIKKWFDKGPFYN